MSYCFTVNPEVKSDDDNGDLHFMQKQDEVF